VIHQTRIDHSKTPLNHLFFIKDLIYISMKLKELLIKAFEGRCERLDGESDIDYINRCGNAAFDYRARIMRRHDRDLEKRVLPKNKETEE